MLKWAFIVVAFSLSAHQSESKPPTVTAVYQASSCKELKEKYGYYGHKDGMYYLTTASGMSYQTYCDMTTDGGGWTLVASVHENDLSGKCTTGDRWSSEYGYSYYRSRGTWTNTQIFGSAESATSDDYKNPGYFDIKADDISVWHVPNDEQQVRWSQTAVLRYHTDTKFFDEHGGNLYHLFQRYPLRYGSGYCHRDNGPVIPVLYDCGNENSNQNLFGYQVRGETTPGFISFRVYNSNRASMAICSGVKPKGCNTQYYCIGGGSTYSYRYSRYCGDFTGLDGGDYNRVNGYAASKELTQAAVLLFYR